MIYQKLWIDCQDNLSITKNEGEGDIWDLLKRC